MKKTDQKKKWIATFDPDERSRKVVGQLLQNLGYRVEVHTDTGQLSSRLQGSKRPDMVFVHLSILGNNYQEVLEGLSALDLKDSAPLLAVTVLNLADDARKHLEELGCDVVLSRQAPLMELMFCINRLLFPKIRELRRYTRVFGGFPVEFDQDGKRRQAEVYNLSREGAFIQLEEPPEEGSRLKLSFSLADEGSPIEVETVVNWINAPEGGGDPLSPAGFGVSFLTLNNQETTTLERFIAHRE